MRTRIIAMLTIALLASACAGNSEKVKSMNTPGTDLTYLALGDSYTIGESVPENERWPVQLVASLNREGIPFQAPRIIARTGWTTGELIQAIADENVTERYSLVSLLIGVNNQYRGLSPEEFREEFTALLQTALGFTGNGGRVVVLTIPDWGVTPFAVRRDSEQIAAEIDLFNGIVKSVSGNFEVPCYDITGISREAADDAALVAEDGLHPSGKMYSLWVQSILPDIVSMFKEK
ncbi:MAG: SGNH/GDSL hydrolase family protein [Bacteroidales bacterium]|nr:SGNH/GDSL hydrolase family protein [Bacteroidales bacterium]